MTYLIVGCGNLGSELAAALCAKGYRVVASYRSVMPAVKTVALAECDVTDPLQTKRLIERCGADELTVFWFASSHNIDRVQLDPPAAARVNIEALEAFLAEYAYRIRRFFYSSSDCVYGDPGSDEPVPESAPTDPVSEYGRQKREAERIVERYGGVTLRFSLLFGESCSGKRSFSADIEAHLNNADALELFCDSRRCVLTFRQAARLVVKLLETETLPGVINVCSDEFLSKYDIGRRIAGKLNADAGALIPIPFEEKAGFAKLRVKSIRLDNSLLRSLTGLSYIESGL